MAFESISEKFQGIFGRIKGKGKLNEKDVKEAMREVKLALLEADVNFNVVRGFIKTVTDRSVGQEVLKSLTPGQQVIKIVNEELCKLMGGADAKLKISSQPPTVVLMAGLQGAGKTTMCGKLGGLLKKQGKSPLLVACDVYRPAAIDQLKTLGKRLELPVFEKGTQDPVVTSKEAIQHAKTNFCDVVIVDTAGRLHVDEDMMQELKRIHAAIQPDNVLLVVDAMTGQDAVNAADAFNKAVDLDGVVLSKLDGDARGGAAISVRAVTGCPILYVGTGEKLEDVEAFHPDRMASRILGMGDMLTLIEKAEAAFDEQKAAELERKLKSQQFTLQDYLEQFDQLKEMGPLESVLGMIPGLNASKLSGLEIDEKQIGRMKAIILSMTPAERRTPAILNASRKKRVAVGSGCTIQDVNRLINQFESTRKIMKQFTDPGRGGKKKRGRMKFPF